MEDNNLVEDKSNGKRLTGWVLNLPIIIGFLILFILNFLTAPLANKDVMIHVPMGQSISSLANDLKDKNVVRSSYFLKVFIKLLKGGKGIVAGDYLIMSKTPVWQVAWQLDRGIHNVVPIKITFREGLTNQEIATIFANKLSAFRKDLFIAGTLDKQGYLFPDTYLFYPLDTSDELIQKFTSNFDSRIKILNNQINDSGESLNQIITMASILEGEAKGESDAELISGILWKRIALNMPLQVDIDKLTYTTKGLPSAPLNNPGLVSIKASLNPIDSPYLYYLHDKNGVVHFAKSFEEHKINIKKYLK